MKPKRINILGVPLDIVTMESAVQYADHMIKKEHPVSILAMNPEKVIRCLDDNKLLETIRSADLLIPDGIGVVFAARILGERNINRVPGADLMPKLCELAATKGYTIFLYGASPEVNELTAEVIRKRYPGIRIAGQQHGYIPKSEMHEFLERLRKLGPDILFVALGSPKQELWIKEYIEETGVKVCQGVGGTFDVISGKVRRAPRIFRSMHLEWFYRLLVNPRRLIRQTTYPRFVWKFMISLLGSRT